VDHTGDTYLAGVLHSDRANLNPTAEVSPFRTVGNGDVVLIEMSPGDYVWEDSNNNGIQDPDELGISAVAVELYHGGADAAIGGGDDWLVDQTTTDEYGSYIFAGLEAGSYYLRFLQQLVLRRQHSECRNERVWCDRAAHVDKRMACTPASTPTATRSLPTWPGLGSR
jgi:hypothetical protein